MAVKIRSELDPLSPYKPPRAANEAAAERGADGYVKLTSNELSFGPLPEAEAALAEALPRANRYPGPLRVIPARGGSLSPTPAAPSRTSWSATGRVRSSSTSSSWSSGRERWSSPGLRSACTLPSATILGLQTTKVPLTEEHEIKPEALLSSVTDETRAVIVSNPNNPTGTYLTFEEVRALAEALPENVLLILDEAYREFVSDPAYTGSHTLALERENVVWSARSRRRTASPASGSATG